MSKVDYSVLIDTLKEKTLCKIIKKSNICTLSEF